MHAMWWARRRGLVDGSSHSVNDTDTGGVWWMDQAIASTRHGRSSTVERSATAPGRGTAFHAERRPAASPVPTRRTTAAPEGSAWTTTSRRRAGFPSFLFLMIRSVSSRLRPVGHGTMCGARSSLFVQRACPTPGLVLPL
jgi:hypothetical protein